MKQYFVTGFKYWPDCEDARKELQDQSAFFKVMKCVEGDGPRLFDVGR